MADSPTLTKSQSFRHGYRVWVRERVAAAWGWVRIILGANWRVVLGSVLACIAVLSIGVDELGSPGVVVVIALIGLVPVIFDWLSVRAALRDLHPLQSPVPDVLLRGDWRLDRYLKGRVATSDKVERDLERLGPINFNPERYALPPELAAIKTAVIAYSRANRSRDSAQPFDGPCVRLCGELDPQLGEVPLRALGYFDVIASDYLAGKQWRGKRVARTVVDVKSHIVDRSGYLIPLDESDMGNQVGISTVAVTSDGWMILVVQGNAAVSSRGLVAPSGSGSLEPSDLRNRPRLVDAVAAGMERELREETGLYGERMGRIGIKTEVIGFGRWLEKGAKPEFFGVSQVNASIHKLELRIDMSERNFVSEHLRISPSDVRRLLDGDAFEELGRGVASVPLEACLDRMRRTRIAHGLPWY